MAGCRFDRIVSDPPFVPGPARIDHLYRDSGQDGDVALAALARALPERREPGGVAQLLGSWLHVAGEDRPDRVRAWLPDGVDAWIVQREVADPGMHVGTWQRDAGLDLASPAARAQAGAWLGWVRACPRRRRRVRADGPAEDAPLAGCRGALPLRDLVELLAFAHDRPVDELVAGTLPAVRELVRHGLVRHELVRHGLLVPA